MRSGSLLEKLCTAHQNTGHPINLGVYYKNTLIALCHALEDFVLESERPPLIIAAFQQGKWYAQEAERYAAIAQKSSQIAILVAADSGFAEHSTAAQDNVDIIELTTDDPVAQEWHLIILSPTYSAMVLCQELSEADYGEAGQPQDDLERKFYGFWTFESNLVHETLQFAIAHIHAYNPTLADRWSQQLTTMTQDFGSCQRDDLNTVVMNVVQALQDSQSSPTAPNSILHNNLLSNEMQAFLRMAQLIDQADVNNPNAAGEVATLAETMGQLLDLPAWQVKRLRLAGLLHRLAPLTGNTALGELQTEAQHQAFAKQGILPKAAVLRIMPQLQAISQIITHQAEAWDGSGIPDGLAYDAIPLESRILAIVAQFQQAVLHARDAKSDQPFQDALAVCQAQAGQRFDPKLAETLVLLVFGLQQGMNLAVHQPKIASGIWLLDDDPAVTAAALDLA
ncbi:DICT sensory domain-containing protein [Spirulina major CS-329]|uniref:DICT sensory domain-containing protein n=1 Tax=Spirulina TaxID=1154 RepID=UPI00232C5AB8|nr:MULTISPECIES: DICT sensory domain-containing protein [Spirulina]MDB9494291.1 DICT sensory domain-containing protein [Spirulina subsalsa CS-330]MDB9502375.1 DICT sensory domain-containing protein [Spirulina major CS-329]